MRIRLGISTCPNDTFAFHALLHRLVDWRGLTYDVDLLDIQQLNCALFAERFDVAKASYFAALKLAQTTVVLPSGSALGFGVGPLLLAARPDERPEINRGDQITLCPGSDTTATLLYRLFFPQAGQVEQVVFSEIMPRLRQGTADFGVCIHEGRFTWQQHGLSLVDDLGSLWENETACPLPLGGILARKSLGIHIIEKVQTTIRESLEFALAHRHQTESTMRRYAQELDPEVIWQHVELYVNDWTLNLGEVGQSAIHQLAARAIERGLVDAATGQLTIFGR
jgi:1,4-dihydroxy-6-naphthoate synthase